MRVDECQRVFELEDSYWWFVGTRNVIYSTMAGAGWTEGAQRVLDVGCGSGIMLDKLPPATEKVGIDIVRECAFFCRQKGHRRICCGGAQAVPFGDRSFDLLIATDVIEHCEDDMGALGEFHRVLESDGRLVISVPAFSFLWSEHDVAVDHWRRYRRRDLVDRVRRAGFRVRFASYFNAYLFPPLALVRAGQRLLPRSTSRPAADYPRLPAWANRFLIGLSNLEAKLLRHGRLPFGTSLVLLAERE